MDPRGGKWRRLPHADGKEMTMQGSYREIALSAWSRRNRGTRVADTVNTMVSADAHKASRP